MTPSQCLAARTLLGWSASRLAERAGVATTTVKNFELGRHKTNTLVVSTLERILKEEGVRFSPSTSEAFPKPAKIILDDGSWVELDKIVRSQT